MSDADSSVAVTVHTVTIISTVAALALYSYVIRSVPRPLPGTDLSFKARAHTFLSSSLLGSALEAVISMFSIGSCITFVWETYLVGDTPLWMFCCEMVFSVFFTFQYVLGAYVAPSRLRFIASLHPVVDVVTVVPVLLLYFSGIYTLTGASVSFLRFSRVMKFARVLRLLRILRSVTLVSSAVTQDAVQNQFIKFVSMLLSLLVITTGFVQFIGNEVENTPGDWAEHEGTMQFHDALYFSIVTFALVGYGDISPSRIVGRISMTLLITIAFIAIPMQMGVLVRKFRMRPGFSGSMRVAQKESHIIVSCDLSCSGIPNFLQEFFHEDHGFQNAKICLLVPGEPNMYMQALILRYRRVTYLQGDAMSAEDLARAKCERAEAAFLLADRFSSRPDEQDSVNVLRAITMKSCMNPRNIYVQILLPENRPHLRMSGIPDTNVLCVAAMKSSMVGLSLQMPGVAPLIQNLVSSISGKATEGLQGKELEDWQLEYMTGLTQEIYSLPLPRGFIGRPFTALSLAMYKRYGVLLFGLERLRGRELHVVLNPGSEHNVQKNDVGFFIAEDQTQLERMLDDAQFESAKVKPSNWGSRSPTDFSKRRVPRWIRRLGTPVAKYEADDGRDDRDSSIREGSDGEGGAQWPDLVAVAEQGSGGTAGGSGRELLAAGDVVMPTGLSSSQQAVEDARGGGAAVEESKARAPLTVTTGAVAGIDDAMSGPSPAQRRPGAALLSSDVLQAAPTNHVLSRHPSHPFMFANQHTLTRTATMISSSRRDLLPPLAGSPKPSPKVHATAPTAPTVTHGSVVKESSPPESPQTPSVFSARPMPRAEVPDFRRLSEAQPASTNEVVGIRIGNANGVAWDRCARTLFKGVERGEVVRRSRRVNLLCALQLFYDSSGYAERGDNEVLVKEVQQVLNHFSSITVPKVLKVSRRQKGRHGSRMHSAIFLQDETVADRYALRILDGTRGLVHGHILVCSHAGTGLSSVIAALRNYNNARRKLKEVAYLGGGMDGLLGDEEDNYGEGMEPPQEYLPQRPIVCLVADEVSVHERERLSQWQDLFIVRGSPTNLPDLVRAGLETASVLACHANPAYGTRFSGAGDAQVVMTSLIVESIYPGLRVVSELNRSKFVKHLGVTGSKAKSRLPDWLFMFEMTYAAGDVVNSSFLEALLCQAFFNSSIISVVEALLDHNEVGSESRGQSGLLTPAVRHRAGLGMQRRSSSLMSVNSRGALPATPMTRGHLFQIDLPASFVGQPYGDLFEHLVNEHDVVPMAMLRAPEALGATLPYILTNPAAELKCNFGDRVFVVGVPVLSGNAEPATAYSPSESPASNHTDPQQRR